MAATVGSAGDAASEEEVTGADSGGGCTVGYDGACTGVAYTAAAGLAGGVGGGRTSRTTASSSP